MWSSTKLWTSEITPSCSWRWLLLTFWRPSWCDAGFWRRWRGGTFCGREGGDRWGEDGEWGGSRGWWEEGTADNGDVGPQEEHEGRLVITTSSGHCDPLHRNPLYCWQDRVWGHCDPLHRNPFYCWPSVYVWVVCVTDKGWGHCDPLHHNPLYCWPSVYVWVVCVTDKGWGHYDPLHRNPLYCWPSVYVWVVCVTDKGWGHCDPLHHNPLYCWPSVYVWVVCVTDKGWGHYDPLHRNPLYCWPSVYMWVVCVTDKGWGHYDPLHRNPLYCHADRECMWELRRLASHHHPSVALFAQTLLKVFLLISFL